MTTTGTIKDASIYVGTYKKYNEGSIYGEWVKLADFSSKEDFYEYCAELHKDEEDAEFMFQDTEYIPKEFVSESYVDEALWELLDMDEYKLDKVLIYHEATGYNLQECLNNYDNMFYFRKRDAYDTMYELYPQLAEIEKYNLDFVTISENDFCNQYTEVEYNGETYCVEPN